MGLFSSHEDSYNQVQSAQHHGHITHDILGGAIAYEAAKAYEEHCAKNGKPDNHAMAKEIIAGLAGAALTRLVETKGRDAFDAIKQKRAQEHAEETLSTTIRKEYQY